MKERLKIVVFSGLVASVFGVIDYLLGLFYNLYEVRSEGLWVAVRGFLAGQLLYLGLGAALGVLAAAAVSATRWLRPGRKLGVSGGVLAVLSGVFVTLLLNTFAPVHSNWKLFLDFLFFLPAGAAAGYGLKVLWEKRLKDFFGSPLRSILFLDLALTASAMLATIWVLRLPVSTKGKIAMLAASGAVLAGGILLARLSAGRRTRAAVLTYAVFILVFILTPVLSYRPKPRYQPLGRPSNPLNVILIVADACRADALGLYGGNNETPNIDRLGREGMVFKSAYAQSPWTLPSMLSALSSQNPSIFRYGEPYRAGPETEFFPERLKGYGYHTRVAMANFLLAGSSGILQGLDEKVTIRHRYRLQRLSHFPVAIKTYYLVRRLLGLSQMPDHTEMITKDAKRFLASPQKPFFLWLHYMNPHEPYNPPEKYLKQVSYKGFLRPPFVPNDAFHVPEDMSHPQELELRLGYVFLQNKDKQYIRDLYLAQLRYLDEEIGELIRDIKSRGLEKNTLVIFTSDHGEEFWEHDNQGHGCGLYEELVRVPLIFWGGGVKPGVVDERVQLLDLVPSLADFLGVARNPVWQGKSFGGLLRGNRQSWKGDAVFGEGMQRPEEMQMIRRGDYKLIIGLYTGKKWLFNLRQDPKEKKNIYGQDQGVAHELEKELAAWSAGNAALRSRFQTRQLSPEEKKEIEDRLRAAGYLK